jgi:hypothetical protein
LSRKLGAVLGAVVAGLLGAPGAQAAQDTSVPTGTQPLGIDVKAKQGDPGVTYDVAASTEGEAVDTAGARRRTSRGGPAQVFYATFTTVETQADGQMCVRTRRRAYPNPVGAAAATDAQNALWRLAAASFPLCARTPVPESTPAAQAAEFWRVVGEDLLPRPAPRIAPGYMLAGKLAYLEAGTVPFATFEHPTPAGVLRIEARAEGWVDWGDGSPLDGPYDHAGGPWPDGTITHYWTTRTSYRPTSVQ